MKTKNRPRFALLVLAAAIFSAVVWSCGDDDPTLEQLREDKLAFLADSLRISDSLRLTNNAGVVNYAISVVNGSTSSIYSGGRTSSAVDGAIITISQYGKTLRDTTDASGMVVFNGFFRSAVNITVEAADFTKVSYISAVHIQDSTRTGTISFVGNLIPIFPTTGAGTATISGRATIETDLTNKTRENVPDGTPVSVAIDAKNATFNTKYLTGSVVDKGRFTSACGCQFVYIGNIMQASYATGVVGSTTGGNYTVTVPAAIDELPLSIRYSDIAATQTLFESGTNGQRTITPRAIFVGGATSAQALPGSSTVTIGFESFISAATASAVISANAGTLDRINVTDGGTGYISATPPLVEIVGGGGTGATATATVGANGRVTGITLTNPGTGYTSSPSVNIISGGTSATANAVLDGNNQQVFRVNVTAQGTGYTSAPTIGFTGGGGTGASASAQIANGRLVAIVLTSGGTGFTGAPTVTITGGGGSGATASVTMGQQVAQVNMVAIGSNHIYTPTVTFSAPDFPNGVRAQGQAIVDPGTRTILGVLVTNPGSGYIFTPSVTINGGSGAAAQVFLTGGTVISANITAQGDNYAYTPTVVIGRTASGGGAGATGTAVMANGKVIGINITNGGGGYTSAPSIELEAGDGANAFATIVNGAITAITVTDGGRNFAGAPRVVITSANGGGAAATATVAGGQITGVTVSTGGSGYLTGNTPGAAEVFSSTKGTTINVRSGIRYINDIYYGTGTSREPVN